MMEKSGKRECDIFKFENSKISRFPTSRLHFSTSSLTPLLVFRQDKQDGQDSFHLGISNNHYIFSKKYGRVIFTVTERRGE